MLVEKKTYLSKKVPLISNLETFLVTFVQMLQSKCTKFWNFNSTPYHWQHWNFVSFQINSLKSLYILGSIQILCDPFSAHLDLPLSPLWSNVIFWGPPPLPPKRSHNFWTTFDANWSIYDWYSLLSSVKWGVQPPS